MLRVHKLKQASNKGSVVTTATALALQGCIVDIDDDHTLSDVIEKSENVTVESCISQCRERGYRYAGVQYEQVRKLAAYATYLCAQLSFDPCWSHD